MKPSPRVIQKRKRPLVFLALHDALVRDAPLVRAIREQAEEFGWDILDAHFTIGSLPAGQTLDGAIIRFLPSDPLAKKLRGLRIPSVRCGRFPHPADHLLPAVLPDEAAGARMAAEHLIKHGCRSLAYIGRKPWAEPASSLYKYFNRRATELGFACQLLRHRNEIKPVALKYARQARALINWLTHLPKPVGIFTFHDREAAKICTICRESIFAVPEDVAVLGLGNWESVCKTAPIPISSIDIGLDECGRRAARLLRDLMQGKPAPRHPILIPPRGVITRRSTDRSAVANPAVARALRFMADHLAENISVADIARGVGVTLRGLERAFSMHLKRTINTELRDRRLARCCELLRTTELTITDIVPQVGFQSGEYLHATFKKVYGMTPRVYRLQKKVNTTAGAQPRARAAK